MYKIEVINVMGIVPLDNTFETYEEAEKFAEDFSSKHCSVLNIDIIEYNPTIIKGEPAKGIKKLVNSSSYGMINTESFYIDIKKRDDDISLLKEEINKKYAKQKELYLELTGQKEMSKETKEMLDKAKARFK